MDDSQKNQGYESQKDYEESNGIEEPLKGEQHSVTYNKAEDGLPKRTIDKSEWD